MTGDGRRKTDERRRTTDDGRRSSVTCHPSSAVTGPRSSVFLLRSSSEVDFILRKGHTVKQLIQVCHNLENSKTLKRETDALTEAASELDCRDLLLITWDQERTLQQNGQEINIVPAWKWMNLKRETRNSEHTPPVPYTLCCILKP